ncbi:MAG: T9SS type A sorting domain-containing protein, partial [candidate division WOR-3 bacterium]|nr:T9SS type A sorting domain-containing protein [candidate division WOR-3 bacterium]
TSLEIHDAGVRNAMNDRNGGLFAVKDRPLSFWAVVKNYGNQSEAAYKAYFKVLRQNNSVVFSDSMTTMASNPGEIESLALASTWRPTTNGTYIIKVFTKMTGDMLVANDSATLELHVVTIPAMLGYDSGTPGNTMYWNGPGGFANRFVPPVYPCSVMSGRVYMGMQATPSNPSVGIFDDNGSGGGPGETLYMTTVNVPDTAWYSITPPSPIVINDGAFFVGAMSNVSGEPTFGMDSIPPLSFQGWEYTGVWSPSRDGVVRDVCANATISGWVGIFEELSPTPAPLMARIDVNPNPFGGATSIRLLNPTGRETAVELYDATGSVVRTLTLSRGQATLDGRLLADGIYFARVIGTESPVAKVIVTH